jgi:hypothetical protein
MAGKKTTSTRSRDTVAGKYCDSKPARGGGDDRSKSLNGHDGNSGLSRSQPTADELGRRAWETTYKNRQKSRRA